MNSFKYVRAFQIELEFRSIGFWGEGKTGVPGENWTSRSKEENQQQTQPTYGVGVGIRTLATLVVGSGVTINRILDYSRLWPFGSIYDSLLPHFDFASIFAHLFQGALSELLYCKIRIQISLKCAFLIDEQRR